MSDKASGYIAAINDNRQKENYLVTTLMVLAEERQRDGSKGHDEVYVNPCRVTLYATSLPLTHLHD